MDIRSLLGGDFKCPACGRTHRVRLASIEKVSPETLARYLQKQAAPHKKVLLLADNITWQAAGEYCLRAIEKTHSVVPLVLYPRGEKTVTAQSAYLKEIQHSAADVDAILTAGSGTITDLGKIAGDTLDKPVFCFPSAPSMNGYTSPVAAYIHNGLKLTIPVKPALGVFYDPEILAGSPDRLIMAGFADSLAKSSANADWRISSLLTGERYCRLPYDIVSQNKSSYPAMGGLLLEKDRGALDSLMGALNLGGLSMIIAGTSSPASGGEHLISHFMDMHAHRCRDEIYAPHGIQVGTGILISSMIYDAMKDMEAGEIRAMLARTRINYENSLEQLREIFPEAATVISSEFREKRRQIAHLRKLLPEQWERIKRGPMSMVYTPANIKTLLGSIGAPLHLRNTGADASTIYNAITLSRFIRARLTILDLADETGLLHPLAAKYLNMET